MNAFDAAQANALDRILAQAGNVFQYFARNAQGMLILAGSVTLRKTPQPPALIDPGDGQTETLPTDFIGRQADITNLLAPLGLIDSHSQNITDPIRGHEIHDGATVYAVQPLDGARCFRKPNPAQITIRTKQMPPVTVLDTYGAQPPGNI